MAGEEARAVARLVDAFPMYGVSPLLRAWIARCGARASGARAPLERQTLASLRRSLGKTQEEMAAAIGISQSDYSKLERRRDVRLSTLHAAARALGGTAHCLVRLDDDEHGDRLVELVLDADRPR